MKIKKEKAEHPSIKDVTVALTEKAKGDSTMWDEMRGILLTKILKDLCSHNVVIRTGQQDISERK
jgi:hypothetical protein